MNIHTLKIIFVISVVYLYSFKTEKDQHVKKDYSTL